MDWITIIAITITLLLICFFSGVEIAFISVSKLSIELKKKQGSYTGRIWSSFLENPARFIGTTLLIFNILLVIYGLLWSNVLESVWKYWGIKNPYITLASETLVSTLILLFFEFIFKAFFRAKGNAVVGNSSITFIIEFFYSLFSWLAKYFVNIAEWILKYIFNVKLQNKTEVFSKIDLEQYIQQLKLNDTEDNTERNNEIFENVLSLSDTKIRACLIPRKEIVAIDINTSLDDIKNRFIETKLSKLVVYENNIDNVRGYVHQLDMFKKPDNLRSVLLPIPAIPESMNATDLINKLTKERKSIAWVIDEFGGTAGIVTMEDLLEEIFGDINDEYDTKEEFVDKQVAPNEYIFSGRLELDYLIDKYEFIFRKNEETETLSGYIISQHESIPRQKDRIIIDDYQFDILSVSETRIETVKLKVLR
ncbi:MAG: hemolysin family protein [Bacteroidota bacterium]|nr:hemolysin family protein [Bacteroidota bacterium]